jgi:two-component system chemotaxis response regulator CheY
MAEKLPFDPKQLKALVIDSHDLIRKSISKVFYKLEFAEIFECHNGKDAKVVISTEAIDVIICDLELGRITGFELLDFVRNSETGSDIPFIIVTGEADKDDIVKAADKGADDYMLKPFQQEDLERKVIKVISNYQSPGPLLALLRKSERLLRDRQWDKALELVNKVLEKRPDAARAMHLKAVVHAKAGDRDKAIAQLKANIEKHPNYLKNYASIADLHFAQKDYKEAIAAMTQELEINPKQIHRQIKLANMLLKEGTTKGALEHYRLALLENNKNPEALFGMGTAFAVAENLDKAIYYFKRMRRHHPTQIKPLQAIVRHCVAADKPRLAEMALRDEKKNHPERVDVYPLLADFYFDHDQEEAAIQTLWEAVRRKPDFADGYHRLACYYLQKDDHATVSAIFDRFFEATQDPNVYQREADLFLRASRFAQSIAALHKAMQPEVDMPTLFRLLLVSTKKTKQYGKTYFILNRLLQLNPKANSGSDNLRQEVEKHLKARRQKRPSVRRKVS